MLALPQETAPVGSLPAPVWARALGTGSIHRDFGHNVTTNAAGAVLIAARLDRLDGATLDVDPAAVNQATAPDVPLGLGTARLVKLAPGGGPSWTVLLRDAGLLGAPCVALDDAGAAYVAGPYAPDDAGLCGSREVTLTKLGPAGAVEWSRPLVLVRYHEERPRVPVVRVAAEPSGGACVTWIGERRGSVVVRALRVSKAGSIEWEYAFPVQGWAVDPHVGVDDHGGAVLWGTFQGVVSFPPTVEASSRVQARYVARVEADGRVSWANVHRAEQGSPHAITVGRDGGIALATVVQSPTRTGPEARRTLALVRLSAEGALLKVVRGSCDPTTMIPALCLAPLAGGKVALAGYLSGALHFGNRTLRSPTQATEAVFVACADEAGEVSAAVFAVPQLCGGLSVHGAGDGGALIAGWICGAVTLGSHRIASPRDRAVLFLAKFVAR